MILCDICGGEGAPTTVAVVYGKTSVPAPGFPMKMDLCEKCVAEVRRAVDASLNRNLLSRAPRADATPQMP